VATVLQGHDSPVTGAYLSFGQERIKIECIDRGGVRLRVLHSAMIGPVQQAEVAGAVLHQRGAVFDPVFAFADVAPVLAGT